MAVLFDNVRRVGLAVGTQVVNSEVWSYRLAILALLHRGKLMLDEVCGIPTTGALGPAMPFIPQPFSLNNSSRFSRPDDCHRIDT